MRLFKYKPPLITAVYSLLLISLFSQYANTAEPDDSHPETIILSASGWSPMMKSYQRLMLIKILDLSMEKYGTYTLGIFDKEVAVKRVREEIALGRYAHVDFSAMTLLGDDFKENTTQYKLPLFKGVLGLRKLIIRKEDSKHFTTFNERQDFLKYSAGQGTGWQDVGIYKNAGVEVVETVKYTSLFPMLASHRFDYLPLSIVEADDALKKRKDLSSQLQIKDDLYIFYPIPFYLNVTNRYPKLLARIRYGVNKLVKTRSIDPIFNLFFSKYIKQIDTNKATVFVMNNPWLKQQENQMTITRVLDTYFSKQSSVFHLNQAVSIADGDY